MSGWVARILAGLIVNTWGAATKAFMQAYHNGLRNNAEGIATAATRGLRKGMREEEALMVLNFEKRPQDLQELLKRSETYFQANDPKKGGSFYIQSKVYRARECLERAIAEEDEKLKAQQEKENISQS